MQEYAIYRRDSNADGGGRLSVLCMGSVKAPCHRAASDWAWNKFVRNQCQWIELENVKRLKAAKVRCAREVAQYEIESGATV